MGKILKVVVAVSDAVSQLRAVTGLVTAILAGVAEVVTRLVPGLAVSGQIHVVLSTLMAIGVIIVCARIISWCHAEWDSYKTFRGWVERSDSKVAFNTHPNPTPHPSLESKMIAIAKWRVRMDVSRASRVSNDD
jgi:hypothetical protein